MAQIFPFQAYRYNSNRVDLARVLTQPYDKITSAMQERYYALDPHNLIRVEKGRELPGDTSTNNVYTRAAQALEEWIRDGIVIREAAPAIFAYFQEFALPGSRTRHRRKGFVALGRVEDYSTGVVFRHELTHAGPKVDRLELLRHTRTHTGQLFMLYPDPARRVDSLLERVARATPEVEVADEYGVVHRLWPVYGDTAIREYTNALAEKPLIIADGHHRYETALAYRNECRAQGAAAGPEAPHETVMMTFFSAQTEGLTILPTHRLLNGFADFDFLKFRKMAEPYFDWYAYPFTNDAERATAADEFRHDLAARGKQQMTGRRVIGVYPGSNHSGEGAYYLFVLRRQADLDDLLAEVSPAQRSLDVVLLHRVLLEKGLGLTPGAVERQQHIGYAREMEECFAAVDRGEAQMACLLNPVRVEQVSDLALGGQVLPQKSTDFYPKLLSGIAMYRLVG